METAWAQDLLCCAAGFRVAVTELALSYHMMGYIVKHRVGISTQGFMDLGLRLERLGFKVWTQDFGFRL